MYLIPNPFKALCAALFSLFLQMSFSPASAQKWEAGLLLGASTYMGDYNTHFPFQETRPSLGVSGAYAINGTWAARGLFHMTQLTGFDKSQNFTEDTPKSFKRNLYGFSGLLDFHFFRFLHQKSRWVYTPYLSAGLGTYWITEMGQEAQKPASEKWLVGLPLGAGFKVNLKSKFSLNMETQYHLEFSDQLDGLKLKYPSDKDGYLQMHLGISYFIYKGRCPQWR
jgi:hypothetical protein